MTDNPLYGERAKLAHPSPLPEENIARARIEKALVSAASILRMDIEPLKEAAEAIEDLFWQKLEEAPRKGRYEEERIEGAFLIALNSFEDTLTPAASLRNALRLYRLFFLAALKDPSATEDNEEAKELMLSEWPRASWQDPEVSRWINEERGALIDAWDGNYSPT